MQFAKRGFLALAGLVRSACLYFSPAPVNFATWDSPAARALGVGLAGRDRHGLNKCFPLLSPWGFSGKALAQAVALLEGWRGSYWW